MKINHKLTSKSRLIAICLVAILALSSCRLEQAELKQPKVVDQSTSLCRIVTHKKDYIGRIVKLRAVYKSDNSSYSYFKDLQDHGSKCVDKSIIQLGYISRMHDGTVLDFFKAGDAICAKKRSAICALTADVDFSAKVLKDKDGLYLHLEHVKHFEYH